MNGKRAQTASDQAQIPLELLRSTPRDLALTTQGQIAVQVLIVTAVIVLLLSAGVYISASHTSALKREMAREGQLVSGVIVQAQRSSGKNRRDVFIYEYAVDGQRYRGRITTRVHTPPVYAVGGTVPVRYLPSRPSVNWPDGRPPAGAPLWFIPLLVAALLAGTGAMFWIFRRQRELLCEGRPALARVQSLKRVRKGEYSRQRAQIEFTLLSGGTRQAYLDFGANAPQPGSTVVILYDRENPARLMRYPASLVRVETPAT